MVTLRVLGRNAQKAVKARQTDHSRELPLKIRPQAIGLILGESLRSVRRSLARNGAGHLSTVKLFMVNGIGPAAGQTQMGRASSINIHEQLLAATMEKRDTLEHNRNGGMNRLEEILENSGPPQIIGPGRSQPEMGRDVTNQWKGRQAS